MADNGQRNFASRSDRLLVSAELDERLGDPDKSLFIYEQVESAEKDFLNINMSGLYSL